MPLAAAAAAEIGTRTFALPGGICHSPTGRRTCTADCSVREICRLIRYQIGLLDCHTALRRSAVDRRYNGCGCRRMMPIAIAIAIASQRRDQGRQAHRVSLVARDCGVAAQRPQAQHGVCLRTAHQHIDQLIIARPRLLGKAYPPLVSLYARVLSKKRDMGPRGASSRRMHPRLRFDSRHDRRTLQQVGVCGPRPRRVIVP